jgi:hypothetical protein
MVHACQRILKFEVFIIFVYFLDVFSARRGWGSRHGKKNGRQPFSTNSWLKPVLKVPFCIGSWLKPLLKMKGFAAY